MVRAQGGGFLKGTLEQDDDGGRPTTISVGAQDITSDLVMPLGPGRFADPAPHDDHNDHPAARKPTYEKPLAKAAVLVEDFASCASSSDDEGAWEARREMREMADDDLRGGKGKAFSARSNRELRSFAQHAKARQGTLSITKDGLHLQEPENDTVTQQKRITDWYAAERKVRTFMKKDHGTARAAFSRFDANRDGVLTIKEFETGLKNLHLGLSDAQIRELVRRTDNDGSGEVSYPEFLSKFGGDGEGKIRHLKMNRKQGKFQKRLKPPPRHDPTEEVIGVADDKMMPELVCAMGVFLFPIWCLGWIWFNSKNPSSKRLGRISACLSSLCCFGGIVAAIVVYVTIQQQAVFERHCTELVGVMVSIRLTGNNARLSTFWDVAIGDYSKQLKFKTAVYTLYERSIAVRGAQREKTILLDEITALFNQGDGATLQITFRMVVPTLEEAQKFLALAPQWVADGSLISALSLVDLPFDSITITDIVPALATDSPVATPVIFQQTKTIRVSGSLNAWIDEPSAPFLMREPPLTSNILDPFNPDWKRFNASFLKTCWWTEFYTLPADECITNPAINCESNGANNRAVQIEVLSDSTIDVFNVYARQFLDAVGAETTAPMPTWFTDPAHAVMAVAERDLDRCSSTRTTSCKVKYTISIAKGAKESYFWIGVVGSVAEARYIGFHVRTRHIRNYQNQAADNPFVKIALADQQNGAQRQTPPPGRALALGALAVAGGGMFVLAGG